MNINKISNNKQIIIIIAMVMQKLFYLIFANQEKFQEKFYKIK